MYMKSLVCIAAFACLPILALLQLTEAVPLYQLTPEGYRPIGDTEQLEESGRALDPLTLARLREAAKSIGWNTKRNSGLDFGLTRGFSAGQAAKSIMGLVAANRFDNPGKKKRGGSGVGESLEYPWPANKASSAYGVEWYNHS